MNNTRRIYYLDLVKVVGIFLVCLYHFGQGGNHRYQDTMDASHFISQFFHGFKSACVPLMVMVNGALLLSKPYDARKHYKSMVKLFVQYILWRIITVTILLCSVDFDFAGAGKAELVNLYLLLSGNKQINVTHFWFIPALMCVHLLFPFIKQVFDRAREDESSKITLYVSLGLLFLLKFVVSDGEKLQSIFLAGKSFGFTAYAGTFLPLTSNVATLTVYFILGGLLHQHRQRLARIPAGCLALGALVGMSLSLLTWYVQSSATGSNYDSVYSGYASIATTLNSAAVFLAAQRLEPFLAKKEKVARLLGQISTNTLAIYYTHWIVGYTLLPLVSVGNVVKALAFVLIGTAIGMILRKIPLLRRLIS